MKAKELIEILKQLDQEKEIHLCHHYNYLPFIPKDLLYDCRYCKHDVDTDNVDEDVQCIKCGWIGRKRGLYTLNEKEIEYCPKCHEHEILYLDEIRTCDRCGHSDMTKNMGQDDGGAIIYCPKCNWII